MACPWLAFKPFKVVFISFLEGKLVPMRAAGGGWSCFSDGGPSLGPRPPFRVSGVKEVIDLCFGRQNAK